MRFKVYKLFDLVEMKRINISDKDTFYKVLVESPKLEDDEEDDEYAIMYLQRYEEYILGTFVQSYQKVLTKFEENNNTKKEVRLSDSKINDKTLFYINCSESMIYIQSKRYPEYLTPGIMIDRLQRLFGKCLDKQVTFLQTEINNTLEQVEEIFHTSFVSRISFSNLCGLELPKDAVLHNPRKELDEALIESYNTYSKDKIDSMELRAKKGQQIGKNPFAKIGLFLAKEHPQVDVFKEMEVIESGEKVKVKLKGNDSKIINISKKRQESVAQTYDAILKSNVRGYNEAD